jgi:hypothetical protein
MRQHGTANASCTNHNERYMFDVKTKIWMKSQGWMYLHDILGLPMYLCTQKWKLVMLKKEANTLGSSCIGLLLEVMDTMACVLYHFCFYSMIHWL